MLMLEFQFCLTEWNHQIKRHVIYKHEFKMKEASQEGED